MSRRSCIMVPGSTFDFCLLGHRVLTGRSFRDALRSSLFQSIKTNDPRVDFYTMYRREAEEYDKEFVKKFDEDLNTVSIFVRRSSSALVNHLTCSYRRAYSLP